MQLEEKEKRRRRKKKKKKKKKKKENHFGCLVIFWFVTFAMLFHATGHIVHNETLKDEGYVVIKAYKFTVFEILRDFS